MRTALRERGRDRIDRVQVEVSVAEDRFVAGEESAAVAAVEGRATHPRDKLRRVVVSGMRGRPTVVQNVESLVAYGTPLRRILDNAGLRRPGPVLVGGFHGAWLALHEVDVATFSRACLGAYGASTGAGVLIVLPPGASGMVETARIAAYLAGQAAGQCGPCVNGLPRMAELLARVAAGDRDPRPVGELHRLAGLTARRGACHHPDGTVRLVRSAARVRTRHRSDLVSALHIDWTRCRGRGGCVELLAELIGRNEFGYPLIATDTAVPRALQGHARQAVRGSPFAWSQTAPDSATCPRHAGLAVKPVPLRARSGGREAQRTAPRNGGAW